MIHFRMLVPFVVVASACTTVRTVHRPTSAREEVLLLEELNRDVKGASVEVRLREPNAERVTLTSPPLRWLDLKAAQSIRYVPGGADRNWAQRGFVVGFLIGVLGGSVLDAAAPPQQNQQSLFALSPQAVAIVTAIEVGALCAGVGAFIGAYGHHEEIIVEAPSGGAPSASPVAPPPEETPAGPTEESLGAGASREWPSSLSSARPAPRCGRCSCLPLSMRPSFCWRS